MSRHLPVASIMAFVILMLLFGASRMVSGQTPEWDGPYRLSSSNGRLVSLRAATVADAYGNAHVFWIEEQAGERAIMYAQFDGTAWSQQLDLFISSAGQSIGNVLSASIDEAGILHLSWLGADGVRLFFTSVPVHDALSIRTWEDVRRLEARVFRHELHVDANGIRHLITSRQGTVQPGLYYRQSQGGGKEWSDAVWLNPDIPAGYIPDTFQFTVDSKGRLHVLWSEKEESGTIIGAGRVRYTRSVDGGHTWSSPTNLDVSNDGRRLLDMADPSLVVYDDTVHALWAGGEFQYRNQSISSDGGKTWSTTETKVFGELHGQAQGDALLVDANGTVHYVGHLRWPQGMYHLSWDGNSWSEPTLFYLRRRNSTELAGDTINAHGVRAALLRGSQLLVAFYDRADDGNYALYGMSTRLADGALAPIEPTPSVTPNVSPTAVREQTETAVAANMAPSGTATPAIEITAQTTDDSSPGAALMQALLPVLVLMVTVIAFSIRRRS